MTFDISKYSILEYLKNSHEFWEAKQNIRYKETPCRDELVPQYFSGIEIDCHGEDVGCVMPAKYICDTARSFCVHQVDFITGKGLHSDGKCTLKEVFLKMLKLFGYRPMIHPDNNGIVSIMIQDFRDTSLQREGLTELEVDRKLYYLEEHDADAISEVLKFFPFLTKESDLRSYFEKKPIFSSRKIDNKVPKTEEWKAFSMRVAHAAHSLENGGNAFLSKMKALLSTCNHEEVMKLSRKLPNVTWQWLYKYGSLDNLNPEDRNLIIADIMGICDMQIHLKGSRYWGRGDRTLFFIDMTTYGVTVDKIKMDLETIIGKWKEFHSSRKMKQILEVRIFGDSRNTLEWLMKYLKDIDPQAEERYKIFTNRGIWKYPLRFPLQCEASLQGRSFANHPRAYIW